MSAYTPLHSEGISGSSPPVSPGGPGRSYSGAGPSRTRASNAMSKVSQYLRRLCKLPLMDFEFAAWQMLLLCVEPRKVYRHVYYQKQTKNRWARDDPAFVALLGAALIVTALAYGLAFQLGFLNTLALIFWIVFVDFVGIGLLVATVNWWFANHFLLAQISYSVDQVVEWGYAWDIHCNSFFPLYLGVYVIQFFAILFIKSSSFVPTLIANTLYLASISFYMWITFLGYNALPFLKNTQVFLYPLLGAFAIWFVACVTGTNLSCLALHFYFRGYVEMCAG